jgi:hypothetical protein
MNKVSIKLQGGLGNFLFQISCAYSYSKKHNKELVLNKEGSLIVHGGIDSYLGNIFSKIHFSQEVVNFNSYYTEPSSLNYNEIPHLNGNVFLSSYFQSEKYFEYYKKEIQNIFMPKKNIILKVKEQNCLSDLKDRCVIHVRRGNYVNIGHFLGLDYYKVSIDQMKKFGVKIFHIVSDDINWCKKNFIGDEFIFSKNKNDIEDLYFMTLFKNIIIANSSFSWWGAYLGVEKRVLCPKVPFKDLVDFSEYHLESWIKIGDLN